MIMTSLQTDARVSLEFFQELYDKFGIEDEDYSMRVIGSTLLFYYIRLSYVDGIEQILYKKDNNTWEYIT